MKKNETRLMMRSVSFLTMTLSVLVLMTLAAQLTYAQDGIVSAVGSDSLGGELLPVPEQNALGGEQEPQIIETPAATPNTEAAAPVPADPAVQVSPETTPPSQEPLAASSTANPAAEPAPTMVVTPLPAETQTGTAEGNAMDPNAQMTKHSGQFYDSNLQVVPDRLQAKGAQAAPRMVDPKFEPGSVFVIGKGVAGPNSFEAQYTAATRAIKLQRYAAAMEMFEKLYKQNSKDPRVLMGLAIAQQGAGFTESAAQTYEELLNIQPNNADAIVNLMGIMKNQYPSVTLTRLLELRQKYPGNPGIPAQIGMVNADLGNYDDAMRYLEIAASMQPANAQHIFNMAIVADHQGNPAKAIQLYERALQMDASLTGTMTETLPRDKIYDRLVVLRRKV